MTTDRIKLLSAYTVLALTLLAVVGMLVSLFLGRSMVERYAPLTTAVMEFKYEVTLGHLWYEEAISGDRYINPEEISRHFDRAEWYARTMLSGGEGVNGRIIPLDVAELREQIEKTLLDLQQFRQIASERWLQQHSSGIGTEIDQQFDGIFSNLLQSANDVETALRQEMAKRLSRFRTVQVLLILGIGATGAFLTFLLKNHEQRRIHFLQQLQEQDTQLRKLRNYLASVIDSMPSVLIGIDSQQTITQWNLSAEQAFDVSAEEVIGKPLAEVCPHLATEAEWIGLAFERKEQQLIPKRARLKQKDLCFEDISIYPLIDEGIEGAVIRVDDITERVRLEEAMVHSEKMLSIGGLAAGMAHEINNPLAGILQTVSVLDNRLLGPLPANEKAAKAAGTSMTALRDYMQARDIPNMLGSIKTSGARAAEIVHNMLKFAVKGGTHSSQDINKLLEKTVELAQNDFDLKKKFDFRQARIVREYGEGLPLVPCSSSMIQQVLLNILRNGAEAMWEVPDRESCFVLRTHLDKAKKQVCVQIEDNGSGMDEETCKRIFEPFFTTKPVGSGTGLGLSVSYFIIVESHKGELSVQSTPGEGSCFQICLPIG
ncbi:PAS domain S-box-containing protein [Malonomonas rubra DSM 5091]|uniref:histidine kinase n=1 Tax=Malonomonas rubra DSM 5091 TaxID=1122189 RepID=A0A1M6G7W5_MALRU|nr:ATP-binding protein [Malonomonas rubra]SHJ06016.1 PAS domain S-box-containing protein [Malonomonas rubra DSM 5091]